MPRCRSPDVRSLHRGRHAIQASRAAQLNAKRFTVRRIVGAGDLWVTEFILTYDGRPSFTVSVMEFVEGKVARETQYFADPSSPARRAHPGLRKWGEAPGRRIRHGRSTGFVVTIPTA